MYENKAKPNDSIVHAPHENKPLEPVETVSKINSEYDVIVAGTDPEGIAAAVSAARNGLKTLLVDGNNREILGGLFTVGWLNSLDMNLDKNDKSSNKGKPLNKGIFTEWFAQVEGDSFDIHTAANAFKRLVDGEKNIDLLLKVKSMEPILQEGGDSAGSKTITGLKLVLEDGTVQEVKAKSIIDATQDADIAAAAGVPYTLGREDIGNKDSRMAVTLVFRLSNVTDDVWKNIRKAIKIEDNGKNEHGSNEQSAWGYNKLQTYQPVNEKRTKMRGLNIGRLNDDSVLINALQIFGIDGSDPASREEGIRIGKEELPHVVDYIKANFPELAGVELDGTAPELYIRETRHIQGEYRLSMIDVLENRDQWDRIAFGSYAVDIQRTKPDEWGDIITGPIQYAVPLRSIVPLKVDGLLVVGRAASFDTLPHGSARTVPVGMATAEAAGAAAKLSQTEGITFRQLSASKEAVAKLQNMLNEQGMDIKPFTIEPIAISKHKHYTGLKVALLMGLAKGGYTNKNFNLEGESNPQAMVYLIGGAKTALGQPAAMPGDPSAAVAAIPEAERSKQKLTLEQASLTIATALGMKVSPAEAQSALVSGGFLSEATVNGIDDPTALKIGETHMMLKDLAQTFGAAADPYISR